MSNSQFRWLLVIYVTATLAAAGAVYVPDGYSQELADIYALEPAPALFNHAWLGSALGILLMLAAVAGVVGLFFFKRWGRNVFLLATIGGLLVYLFSGPELYSSLESRLAELATLLRGAILALAYFSPIASRLGANNSFKPNPLRGSA